MRLWVLLLINLCFVNMVSGFDALLELKLKVSKKYPPQKGWISLQIDDNFALQFDSDDAFFKSGSCLEKRGGKLFIVENILHKIIVFGEDGKFLTKIGRVGRGPGDLHHPAWLTFYNDQMFISNNNGIELYDKNLAFIRRIRPFMTIYRFSLFNDTVFCNPLGSYRGRYPLILQLNMDGNVLGGLYDETIEKTNLVMDKEGHIAVSNNSVVFIPTNWNKIYILDKNAGLKKESKINYPLLDQIEEWNDSRLKKKQSNIYWFANLICSAKACRDEIYIFLDIPRLEIIQIDLQGNIKNHFYNDSDFKFMRWDDFSVEMKGDEPIFYVMGHSIGQESKRDKSELAVYRLTPVKSRPVAK